MDYDMHMQGKRLDYLDSLRGWAILGVLLIHTRLFGLPIPPSWLKDFIDNGDKGVQLFFVISGLSLALSSEARGLGQEMRVIDFWKRRLARIWPLFAVATIGYYLLYRQGSTLALLSTLTLTHGLSAEWINLVVPGGWAIGTEVLFYILFPWLWKMIRSARAAVIWLVGSMAIAFGLGKLLYFLPGEFLYYYLPAQLPVFLLGVVAYWVIKEQKWPKVHAWLFPMLWVLDSWKNTLIPPYMWFGILWMILVVYLNKKAWVGIDNPVMRYLGKISYEMYLVHFAIYQIIVWVGLNQLTENVGIDALLRWVMAIVGSVATIVVIKSLESR